MLDRGHRRLEGLFVHPVADQAVMAGNGTIGLELCEELAAFDTVVVPWGGGGLTTGIASAVKAFRPGTCAWSPPSRRPRRRSARRFAAGEPVEIDYQPSFVDGAGGRALLPGMWEYAQELVDEAVAVPVDEVADAVRLLAAARGSSPKAPARCRWPPRCRAPPATGRVVCIVSGGNIDAEVSGADPGVLSARSS